MKHEDLESMRDEVNRILRKTAIDANQAANYFEKSQYEGFEKNLKDMISSLQELLEKAGCKID